MTFQMYALSCIFMAIAITSGDALSHDARVLELSDRFLEFRKEGMWLVKFYAPWCGHCKRLEPIFNHVAQALHDSPVRVGKVDATRYPTVSNEFKISGYPTIVFIKGGITHVYQGDRKTEDIVQYTRRMAGPAMKDLKGACSTIQCVFDEHESFFGYVGKQDGALWDAFNTTANQFQAHNLFYYFEEHEVPADWSVKYEIPGVFVRKENSEFFYKSSNADYDPPGDTRNLTQMLSDWVGRERFSTFTQITRSNFPNLLETKKFIVMAVLEEDKLGHITPEMTKFQTMLESVVHRNGDQYHEIFQFGWIGNPSLANSLAASTLPIPSLLVLNSTTFQHHIPDDETEHLTPDAIETFLESILNESAAVYGGRSIGTRIYRALYEGKTSLVDMWSGNPILTTVVFGLPLGFLSLIFYSICCADFMDAPEEEDEPDPHHEKKD